MYAKMADGEDSLRVNEVEMLRSMYDDSELTFPDPLDRFSFVLRLALDDEAVQGDGMVELSCSLPAAYPTNAEASISVRSSSALCGKRRDEMQASLNAVLASVTLDEDDMRVLVAADWVRDHAVEFLSADPEAPPQPEPEQGCTGLMREWCSFASLYKDSYASGPNRFEVMMDLATQRGLAITGMAIAGKPGGLVCEGMEADVVQFMTLMRTEFFETLNPRGRKLTTRLQERWPLDEETERHDAAVAAHQVRYANTYSKLQSGDSKFKPGEQQRLEGSLAKDMQTLADWEARVGRAIEEDEVAALVAAGPPSVCTTPGVYPSCGPACTEPPSRDQVNSRRIFKDFSIFRGTEGYEACYPEAGALFKSLGKSDGFDAMFTFRFS